MRGSSNELSRQHRQVLGVTAEMAVGHKMRASFKLHHAVNLAVKYPAARLMTQTSQWCCHTLAFRIVYIVQDSELIIAGTDASARSAAQHRHRSPTLDDDRPIKVTLQ